MESMDVMSYSYTARAILSEISKLLNDGKSTVWQKKALQVQSKIKSYLWDPVKLACYERDPQNKTVNILLNNNIRCMYYGSFDQQMADAFIEKHLFNPNEFWTKMPLPAIAVNDAAFRNVEENNWSGQSQGLLFQRAIGALENYGHYAEVALIGKRLISALKQNNKFTQQYDPFTAKAGKGLDGYGPTLLSLLEYISRAQGIHYEKDRLFWSSLNSGHENTEYTQLVHGKRYLIRVNKTETRAFIDDKLLFTASANVRFVTDMNGKLLELVGIDSVTHAVKISFSGSSKEIKLNLKPNEVYKFGDNYKIAGKTNVPFKIHSIKL